MQRVVLKIEGTVQGVGFRPFLYRLARRHSLGGKVWNAGRAKFEALLNAGPRVVAFDFHPGYRSSLMARAMADVVHIAVQHHHAHLAACMAEKEKEPGRYLRPNPTSFPLTKLKAGGIF